MNSARDNALTRVAITLASNPKFWCLRKNLRTVLASGIVAVGLLLGAQPASAQTTPNCIQDVWKAHGNNQNLTCTANDVTLSEATNINITAGGSCTGTGANRVCTCNLGGNVTFTADFVMSLTADTRYDIGFYVATDGGGVDGALTGQCSATEVSTTNGNNFRNLDAAPDTCGDITGPLGTAFNPQVVRHTVTAPCSDPDGNEQLDLPFCTTWRQPGSNQVCDGVGTSPATNDVFPGSPSKCNCGTLTVDIFFETASIEVTKTALAPATVAETGGSATYSVAVKNLAQQASVTLDSLTDNKYGDITTTHAAGGGFLAVTATTCTLATIAAQQTYSCQFTGTVPAGDTGGTFTDVVDACGTDSFGNAGLCDDDDAFVTYTDVPQPPTLSKTATATSCRVDTTYAVVVTNSSAQDVVTLNSLSDDQFGVITSAHAANTSCTGSSTLGVCQEVVSTTCGQAAPGGAGVLPAAIAASGQYSCSFVGRINICDGTVTDIVTGGATDDDGASYTLTDDAAVTISTTP